MKKEINFASMMLYLDQFTFNPFQENTYLLYNENKECIIIDPGCFDSDEEQQLVRHLQTNGLKPTKIVNTHCHLDHVFGVNFIQSAFKIPFYTHPLEELVLAAAPEIGKRYGVPCQPLLEKPLWISEKETLTLGDEQLQILFTPGHSPGSISFYHAASHLLISGDVLFKGSIGRTDLPGGNFSELEQSIRSQLYTLPDQTKVYSGHGPVTTIGEEKRSNPFVKI
jgi:glyoxylase-like metal-dependent hydrolase (beta-lactamase superfamily II)